MMNQRKIAVASTIRPATITYIRGTIDRWCKRNGVTVTTGQGWTRNPHLIKLQGLRLTQERCSWQYPSLKKKGHFHTGVKLLVRVVSDEYGPGYPCLIFKPEHNSLSRAPEIDLEHLQEDYRRRRRLWTLIIQEKIKVSLTANEEGLEAFK